MAIGPPNALVPAKPRSSIRTITTLGAPAGALTSKRGGGVALRTSSSVYTGLTGSGMGSTVRSGFAVTDTDGGDWAAALAARRPASGKAKAGQDLAMVFSLD